jgi:aspartate--ammonia ligase
LKDTESFVNSKYPQVRSVENANKLPDKIKFIHTEELDEMYPSLDKDDREEKALKQYGAIFLIGIGWKLPNLNKPHEERAPDYDDWSTETTDEKGRTLHGLNGDILVWNSVLGKRFEISSMGIRVSKDNLVQQLELTNMMERKNLYFHQRLLKGELPNCIGGGIGLSRVFQLLLQKKHIGEVSVAVWPDEEYEKMRQQGVQLL